MRRILANAILTILVMALLLAVSVGFNIYSALQEPKVITNHTETIRPIIVEKEVVKEVEVPYEVEKVVEKEVPVTKVVTKEVPVQVPVPVEVKVPADPDPTYVSPYADQAYKCLEDKYANLDDDYKELEEEKTHFQEEIERLKKQLLEFTNPTLE